MMVKDTTGQVSVSTDDSFAEADGAPPSSGPGTTHQAHEEPLMKSTAARHKLKFTSSRTKLWRNLSRKQRSSSHGSFKMANSSMTDELLIDDSNVILQDSVQLTNCLQTRQRYLFLLSNVLVLAKQKSPANFTVKDEIRLCEIWLSDCVDQVSEVVCDRERSFVIGWPTVNMVATFASIHIRDVWLSKLQQQIAEEKAQEWPPNVVIKIINASQAFSVVKSMLVQNCESAKDIVMRCVQEMHIPSASVNDFQFWVQSEKENHPYPLIGHEFPYAIQMNYIHTKQGSSDSAVSTDVSLHDGLRFQIVPKQTKSKLSMKLSLDETRRCPKKTSKIVRLFKKSSRSVDVGNIFGRHLSDLFDGGALCAPVMDILSHLFVHGPSAVDIFRKSAIVSRCHEVKQHLDGGDKVDFNDVHVGVSAALLKELLRCLPNCLLLCELYSKWIKISAVIDNQHLANDRLKSLVQVLPPSHLIFLRYLMCILYRISLRSDHNGMTAYSLSICISPSLLWPRSSYGAAISQVNDAKKLNAVVEHMIECTDEIFGPDCLHVFDHLIPERNQPRDVSENVGQGANSSLDIVKEESMADGVEQDIDVTCSASDLGHQSPDVTPTSTRYDSGLATSNSLSYNDFVLMTALGDCSPSAETYSGSDLEPASSLVTPNTSVNCVSRMDTRKCRFEDVSGWFHLAIEDDTNLESPIRDSYPAGGEVCESLPETYLSGANLSAEFHSETEQVSVGMLRSLNTSNTELSDEMQTLVGAKPVNVDSKVLDRSSSLDESQTVGLTLKQDVVKIDQGSFEMESGLSTVGSEANRLSRLNLRSVCSSGDLGDPSSETVSSICQSLPSAALPKQTLSSASVSCDVPDSQHSSSRCEEKTVLVTEVEQKAHLPEQEVKRDKILCNPRSFKGILSRERTNSCENSSTVESKSSSLNLRRGMTKCGSDIFPKYFLEGLHCTFGEVMVYNGSEEEERLTGKSRGIGQSKAASTTTCGLLETPWHAMVRPPRSLSKGHHFNSFCHPVAPCIINSGHRVRPARPPSYAEAVAAKALQGSSVGSPGSGQNVAGFASHSSLVMEGHPVPSIGCTDRNEEARVPTLPSVRSVECARNPIVPGSVVTCGLISRALQSVSSVAGMGSSTTVQSIPSTGTGSKPISSVSTNSETVASFEHARTARLCGECKGEPLSIQNSDMPNELCVFDVLPNEPSIGSVVVSSDYITRSVNSLSQTCSNVRNENNRTGVCALTAKQRLDQKVRVRKRRQRSTDPKLHSSRAFGRGIGRSKSDSSEILEKKRHEYNSDEDKENVLVPSNSFLKRKLAAMKQASKEEELRNASHCSKCTVPCHLSMVSEESSTYANERESACSPRDMKKKKSLLFECHDLRNEEAFHSSSLNGLELTDSLQHEMEAFRKDEFCKERIEREPPLYSKTVFVSQNMSFNGRYCPSESFNISSQQDDESSVRKSSSSASAPSSARHPYLFRAAKLPVPDAIKVNWSVSKLKQAYDDQSDSRPDAVACLPRMIALHDLPYFV